MKKKSICIVSKSQIHRKVARGYLENAGYDVTDHGYDKYFNARLRDTNFDLFILCDPPYKDLNTWFQTNGYLMEKANRKWIFATHEGGDISQYKKALDAKASAVVAMPFAHEVLIEKVKQVIGEKGEGNV